MPSSLRRAGAAALLALTCTSGAHANLVTNGGFETGDFSGWTKTGSGSAAVTTSDARTGVYGAGLASFTAVGVSQQLATQAGSVYDVGFWVRHDGPADNLFAFNWDGGVVEQSFVDIVPGYATLHYTLQASSASTEISFIGSSNDGRWSLDDVTVTQAGTVALPGTLVLVLTALETLFLLRRGRAVRAAG